MDAHDVATAILALGLLSARALVGAILILAGIAKLQGGHERFLSAVLGYELIRGAPAVALARVLPFAEVLVGAVLIVGLQARIAAAGAGALLAIFSAAVAASLIRGRTNSCGCGDHITPVQWRLVRRDLFLLLLLLPVLTAGGGPISVDGIGTDARLPMAVAVSAAVLALGGWLVIRSAFWIRFQPERIIEEGQP